MIPAPVAEALPAAIEAHRQVVELCATAAAIFALADPGPTWEPPIDLLYDILASAERHLSEVIDSHGVIALDAEIIANRLAALGAER